MDRVFFVIFNIFESFTLWRYMIRKILLQLLRDYDLIWFEGFPETGGYEAIK